METGNVETLARDTEKLSLDWPDEPRESQSSKLDERFLSGSGSRPTRRMLPFFPDLHHKVSRSWKWPFSSRLTNAAAADFTNLFGSVEQGYATVPVIEGMLAVHLSPNSAPSWKSRPLLSSKPFITTSALIGKSYIAVGHSMAGLVMAERHLWLNLTEKEKAFLLDAPISGSGLFTDAVNTIVNKFRAAKMQFPSGQTNQ